MNMFEHKQRVKNIPLQYQTKEIPIIALLKLHSINPIATDKQGNTAIFVFSADDYGKCKEIEEKYYAKKAPVDAYTFYQETQTTRIHITDHVMKER